MSREVLMQYDDYTGTSGLVPVKRIVPPIRSLYICGSLRNPKIVKFASKISSLGIEAFADWYQPGPNADDYWRKYSRARGWTYRQALDSYGADQIFDFDKFHLERCDGTVMLAPAGKSAHTELGYTVGMRKPAYIVFEKEPKRWEVMVKFATQIFFSQEEFIQFLKENPSGYSRRNDSHDQV